MTAQPEAPMRPGSARAHRPTADDLERLAEFGHLVVAWIDDAGYPVSVATTGRVDVAGGTVELAPTAGLTIPTDRELDVIGSRIRPQPGVGYDQRRYVQLWGRVRDGLVFEPIRAWGWDENELPFFEYSERSVPQSRRYLAQLSEEKGRTIRPASRRSGSRCAPRACPSSRRRPCRCCWGSRSRPPTAPSPGGRRC
jgi:hypothetical protein